jgi:hypothetical protein
MEQESFDLANKVSAKLMNEGYIVFSPISHSHPIAESQKLPGTWDFWQKFDEAFIEWCDLQPLQVRINYLCCNVNQEDRRQP